MGRSGDVTVAETESTGHDKPRRSAKKSASENARDWIKSILIALVIWFFVRSLLVEAFRIPSGSMENTLLIGDFLFVNKALYGAELPIVHRRLPAIREPERFDIVIFYSPEEPGVNVVKRVIGMPGDTLSMVDGDLYLNGVVLEEPHVTKMSARYDPEDPRMREWQVRYLVDQDPGSYSPSLSNWGPIAVPPDSFFVMGDNRDNSYDSRYWGYLGRDRIAGRPLFIYYSFDRGNLMPFAFLTGIRWGRLFSTPE